jgi:FAD/FMN-containing dehydrogenase
MADAKFIKNGRKSWTNWHHSVRERITDLFDLHNEPLGPGEGATTGGLRRTTAMIQGILGDAISQNVPVHALGGGWSFSRAPGTEGWLLNTLPLNWIFPISGGSLVPARAAQAPNLFLAQCGNNISELNRYFETTKDRSLRTTGASNGQTIAGAISTGMHGSAIDVGAMQDQVVGIHLITGPDRHIWLEPASNPLVSQAFLDALGTELVRDDALFNAALVSFGGFGIIHAVMVETTDRFLLEARRARMGYSAGLKQAITSLDFSNIDLPDPSARPYFFQMVLNPHSNSKPAYVTTMYKRPFPGSHMIDYSIKGGLGPGYDLPGFLGSLADTIPAATPLLVSKLTEIRLKPFSDPKIGTLGETFDFTTPRAKAAGTAIAVPLSDTVDALKIIRRLNDDIGPAPVVFACRFVQRSQGTLAFTRYDPTCVIDIDGVSSKRTKKFFKAAWLAINDAGIPCTQHWGKMNDLDAASVRRAYGADIDAWISARHTLLPDSAHRRLFSNRFIADLGLDA